jgi:beta-glucanase (GH16 family)
MFKVSRRAVVGTATFAMAAAALLYAVLAGVAIPKFTSAVAAPAGIPGRWHLVWSDEFGGSALDSTKWSTGWFGSGVTPPVNSLEVACYDPAQLAVSGGNLGITAIAKAQTVNGRTYPYTSGIVTTMGKYAVSYGVMEARIYLPGSGSTIANWPAFWANGSDGAPITGELDAMEGRHGVPSYHFHSPAGAPGGDVAGDFTGWHTYAADWQPGVVTYYYDGKKVGQITSGITAGPMYLILNYGIGTYGGPISTPATMQVDWVRVWK